MARSEPTLSALNLHEHKGLSPEQFLLRRPGRFFVKMSPLYLKKRLNSRNETGTDLNGAADSMQTMIAGVSA